MQRIDCLKCLVPFIKDQLLVVSLGRTAEEWEAVCPHDGNMFDSGMGHHIPVALGLATALPHRQVVLLATDGSVLMLLSSLTSLANRPAKNLKIFVFDNEAYEGTGEQPSATAGVTDIAAIAQGTGIKGAKSVGDLDSFRAAARDTLAGEGLAFIIAKVELAKGPRPGRTEGHRETLIRFIRHVESTEKRKILHSQYE